MKPEQISQTKVWRINDCRLVIAGTIPLAIEIYNAKYPLDNVEKVELIKSSWDYSYALINDDLFKEEL